MKIVFKFSEFIPISTTKKKGNKNVQVIKSYKIIYSNKESEEGKLFSS